MVSEQEKSQRRDRAAIVADVREALVRVLERKPFNDVTVDELAREAGLSRTAFYFYYKDKNQVLGAVLEGMRDFAVEEATNWWSGEGPPDVVIRTTLRSIATLWETHAGVLRAAVEVASYDPGFWSFYKGLMDDFIQTTQEFLAREREAGKLRPEADPERHAEMLVWMGERCHYVGVHQGRPPEETTEILLEIWVRTLYPDQVRTH